MSLQSTSQDRSFWSRWRALRIVASTPSELVDEGPIPRDCYSRGDDAQVPARRDSARVPIALAARWNSTLVGGAILDIRDSASTVRALYVAPTWRGRGVGQRLLRGLLKRARLQFVREVYAFATAADAGFYAVHGFRPVEKQAEAPSASNRFASIPMRRRLTSGLVNTPIDGITVKM